MKSNRIILFLFIIVLVFSTQFFNYAYWKLLTGGLDIYYYALYPAIVLFAFLSLPKIQTRKTLYSKEVFSMFLVSFLCLVTIAFERGGFNMDLDLPPMLFSMTILAYFLLIRHRVSQQSLINCLTLVGILIFLIQAIQQINPSIAVFGIFDPNNNSFGDVASIRNNLYRFLLPTYQLSIVCMFYWWSRMLDRRSVLTVSLFVIFAASTYLYLTRQIIFSSVIVLSLTPFWGKSRKLSSFLLPVIFILFVLFYGSSLFGDFIEMTKIGGDSTENRLSAYSFFWGKIIESPTSFFFGNGTPIETLYWHDIGLNASDIGIVGEVFHKGVFALFVFLILFYKLLVKNSKSTPFFIKLYAIFCLINSLLAFPYLRGYEYFLWAILLYLSEQDDFFTGEVPCND